MTATNIIKNMTARGNVVLGSGCYAAALSTSDDTKIIKVSNDANDPWVSYYTDVISELKNNLYVPQVYSFYRDADNDYYIATMEKLYTVEYGDEAYEFLEHIIDFLKQEISEDEFLEIAYDYVELVPDASSLLYLLRIIRDKTDVFDKYSTTDTDDLVLDLHYGNIMTRADGTLVITDPWCDCSVNETKDMGEWLVKNNMKEDYDC